jgi:hypothetical protein
VRLSYGHGGFHGRIVFRREELRGPGNSGGTFKREDAGVAGTEELRFVGGELGTKAEEERGRVGADLLDRADGVDSDGEFLIGQEWREMGEDAMAV